eukprot:4068336-Lingulodinium_polyedra.AAC.1
MHIARRRSQPFDVACAKSTKVPIDVARTDRLELLAIVRKAVEMQLVRQRLGGQQRARFNGEAGVW